ncbi:MAG: PD-(D/E)XK nuclease family transposase, partial [Verrucomicrobia bacterium]|nr:PD-(D/E)XK nuclease family transposase [Verrucomicrobiota bacterium]
MHFLDPTNDYAFKRVFGDEKKKEILMSFLNSLLGRQGDNLIVEVHLLNPYQAPHMLGTKESLLDIRCRDQRGREYIVEMQVIKQKFFDKRVLYYTSKAYSSQLLVGEDYGSLNAVIFLGILNFKFTDDPHWLSAHRIYNVETREHKIKDFDLTFVELPKFTKKEEELSSVADKWIYFLKYAKELETVPETIVEEAIKEAFEIINQGTWSRDQLNAYEDRKKALMDEMARYASGVDEGEQRGIEKGIVLGRKEGIVLGR